MSVINDRALRETVDLALYTKVAMEDVSHSEDMQFFVQNVLPVINTQLKSRSEGEKVTRVSNVFEEAMGLREATRVESNGDGQGDGQPEKLNVYRLVPKSTILPGTKTID